MKKIEDRIYESFERNKIKIEKDIFMYGYKIFINYMIFF